MHKKNHRRAPKKTHQSESDLRISLKAKEFPHHPKNTFWYFGMGLLIVACFIVTIIEREYLLSAVVVAVALAVFRVAHLRPSAKDFEVSTRGVYWGDVFYPYHRLKAFWLARTGDNIGLYLERLNLAPALHVVIPANRAEVVIGMLSLYLPFHNHRSEPLPDKLNRLLKL